MQSSEDRFAEPDTDDELEDPPGWVDGAPTSGQGQSCALCGSTEVEWIHPLDDELIGYEQYGRGHTLPTFWALCDPCEGIYVSGNTPAALEVMKSSAHWAWKTVEDVAETIQKPLDVFRRADRGARRLGE